MCFHVFDERSSLVLVRSRFEHKMVPLHMIPLQHRVDAFSTRDSFPGFVPRSLSLSLSPLPRSPSLSPFLLDDMYETRHNVVMYV